MLPKKPWQPHRVLWLFCALLACVAMGMLAVQGYAAALKTEENKEEINLGLMLMGTLMSHGVAIVLVSVFLREYRLSWREAFGFAAPRLARALGLAIIAAAIVLPIAWSLGEVSRRILLALNIGAEAQQSVRALQNAASLEQQIYFAIVAIFFAPFVEEVVFRGILYPTIKQQGFKQIAFWGTSFLFALTHFNAMTFVPLAFFGVVLVLLYETTQNLFAPILAHALFNAANYAWLLYQQSHSG